MSKSLSKTKLLSVLSVVSVILIVGIVAKLNDKNSPSFALAGAQNTYTDIYMPASNLTNISHNLTINNVANLGTADYFWSHQFSFSGSGMPTAGGAYIGLQGINRAIFSVFDYASPEASSDCSVSQNGFDGYTGESGTSCIMSYTVTQGHTYRLQVTDVGQDSQGINWQGEVTDLTTGQTTVIATVNVDASWGDLSSASSVWTEWFGSPPSSCSALPYSDVTFSDFTANNGQYTSPSSTSDSLQTGTGCSGYSQIVDNSYNSFTQIMGINPPITNTIVPYSPPPVATTTVKATPPPISTKTTPPSKVTTSTPSSTSTSTPSSGTSSITPSGTSSTKSSTEPNSTPTSSSGTTSITSTSVNEPTLNVIVTGINGSPASDVKVTINGISVTTDSNGLANFNAIKPGLYSVIIQPKGGKQEKTQVNITSNEATQQLSYRLTTSKTSVTSLSVDVIVCLFLFALMAGVLVWARMKRRDMNSLGSSQATSIEQYIANIPLGESPILGPDTKTPVTSDRPSPPDKFDPLPPHLPDNKS
jgi:hypothetical protein